MKPSALAMPAAIAKASCDYPLPVGPPMYMRVLFVTTNFFDGEREEV